MNETLQELHLLKHCIRDFGATRLADELQHNFTLRYLALSWYSVTQVVCNEAYNFTCTTLCWFTCYGPMSVSACLSASVINQCSIKWLDGLSWFLAWRFFLTSPTLFLWKFWYQQNKGTSLWNFVLDSRLRKFFHSISIERCYQLN